MYLFPIDTDKFDVSVLMTNVFLLSFKLHVPVMFVGVCDYLWYSLLIPSEQNPGFC